MSGVDLNELGLRFVQVCLKEYWGECAFLLLFLIGIIWTIVCHKKQIARGFLPYVLFLVLTVYNPICVKYVVPILDFDNEYYRFFWMLPVVPVVSYYIVKVIYMFSGKVKRVVIGLLCLGLIVFVGVPIEGVATNYSMVENIYKVSNELRAVCDVIHQDSTKENPKVVFAEELNSVARQYDPSLFLTLDRDAVIYRAGSTIAGKINEEKAWYQRQKIIMDVVYYEMDVSAKKFKKALSKTKTDYLVLKVNMTNHDFIRECGCIPIAQSEKFVVYRYEWE